MYGQRAKLHQLEIQREFGSKCCSWQSCNRDWRSCWFSHDSVSSIDAVTYCSYGNKFWIRNSDIVTALPQLPETSCPTSTAIVRASCVQKWHEVASRPRLSLILYFPKFSFKEFSHILGSGSAALQGLVQSHGLKSSRNITGLEVSRLVISSEKKNWKLEIDYSSRVERE